MSKNIGLNRLLWAIAFYHLNAYNTVQAQVTEDNTLSTKVNSENNRDFTVNAGEQRGNNLFHSFREFSIPNNGSVFFDNAATIQNIISRVTGSSVSEINGLIQNNGTANLFLINPNGIIFGENATLNIGGSFIGTTAESLVFQDGSQFSSIQENIEPLLTVSVPLGLQFGSNPGKITNKANFSTAPGKTLALLGGDIIFDGGAVNASAGNIELGSLAENSFVALKPIAQGWNVNYDNVNQFRNIVLDNLASVDASGEGAGDIHIRGKNIQIFNGSSITSNTLGNLDGGKIQIQASDLVEINGSDPTATKLSPLLALSEIFLPFSSQISSHTVGAGSGGDIEIITQDLQLIDGGSIELQTFLGSTGKGGDLSITATGFIRLNGTRPLLGVGENAQDLIGISINLDSAIEINQASEISTAPIGSGDGGNIDISAKNIRLEDAGVITTSPFGRGNAGNINLDVIESIEVIGISPRTGMTSSTIAANTFAAGNAGTIDIDTNRLIIKDGGQVVSTSFPDTGTSGEIKINSSSIEIDGFSSKDQRPSLLSTETNNTSEGGNIFINTDSLVISNQGLLNVMGTSSGTPGNLFINANTVELNNRAKITAENAAAVDGGNIILNIQENLTLENNSLISAQAFGEADGGNIDIDAEFVIAFPDQNSDILANAFAGNGGNINLAAEGVFGIEERRFDPPNSTNDIDASSEFGKQGSVTLNFPQFTDLQGLFNLAPDFVDVNYLLNNNFCKISQDSKYIITGRGGIPLAPEDDFITDHTWSDWRIIDQDLEEVVEREKVEKKREERKEREVKKIEMIQGWVADHQGRIMLTVNPPVVTPHKPELNTPDCNQVKKSKVN